VRFVDYNQVERAELLAPLVDGLNAGDDDRMRSVPALQTRRIDAEANLGTDLAQLVRRLLPAVP